MKLDEKRLQKFKIFNNLGIDEIKVFLKKIDNKSFKKNEVIMHEGDTGETLLFLLDGEVNITKALTLSTNKNNDDNDLREKEFIRVNSDHNVIIGELSLFTEDSKRSATVKALTDCKIAYLNKKDFFKICEENPGVGYKIINELTKIIAQRLVDTNHQVLKLTTAFGLIVDG